MTSAAFSFMLAGPTFRLDLPVGFDVVPELSSPVYNGNGVRDFDFLPPSRHNGVESNELLDVLGGRDGRSAELYVWPWEPPQWYLHWQLSLGDLYTHFRDEDGPMMAQLTVDRLSLTEDGTGGTPFILLSEPLMSGIGARTEFREIAIFHPNDGSERGITLRRPGFLSPGDVVKTLGPIGVELRAGLPFGIEVGIRAPDMAAAVGILTTLRDSITDS